MLLDKFLIFIILIFIKTKKTDKILKHVWIGDGKIERKLKNHHFLYIYFLCIDILLSKFSVRVKINYI